MTFELSLYMFIIVTSLAGIGLAYVFNLLMTVRKKHINSVYEKTVRHIINQRFNREHDPYYGSLIWSEIRSEIHSHFAKEIDNNSYFWAKVQSTIDESVAKALKNKKNA